MRYNQPQGDFTGEIDVPSTVGPGDSITVRWSVTNVGSERVTDEWALLLDGFNACASSRLGTRTSVLPFNDPCQMTGGVEPGETMQSTFEAPNAGDTITAGTHTFEIVQNLGGTGQDVIATATISAEDTAGTGDGDTGDTANGTNGATDGTDDGTQGTIFDPALVAVAACSATDMRTDRSIDFSATVQNANNRAASARVNFTVEGSAGDAGFGAPQARIPANGQVEFTVQGQLSADAAESLGIASPAPVTAEVVQITQSAPKRSPVSLSRPLLR